MVTSVIGAQDCRGHPAIPEKKNTIEFLKFYKTSMGHLSRYLRKISNENFSSLHIRNYRLYYFGQVISTSGTFMQSVAQTWLVLKLTNSGAALGLAAALQYLPILILGPYGGLIADRFPKRKILYFTQSLAGVLALILGVLVATNLVKVWMVYILAFCLGLNNVFDNPTRQTFYIELVGPDHLRNAVTLYSTLVNLARIIGPAIAGGLITAVGLAPCFLINAVSYIAVLIVLTMIRPDELIITPPAPRAKGQVKEGFRYVVSTPILGIPLLMMAILGTFTYEFQVSLPLIAQFTFNGDASSYAFLTASMGFGAAIGGIFFASRKGITASKLASATLFFGLAVLTAAFMPSLLLTGLVMVIVGLSSINFSTLGNSLLQLKSSPQMRGRVMSFWAMAFLGSTTIGGPIVGWFGEIAGARAALALGGVAALAAAVLGAITLRKTQ
ncbi:MAG: MFS transporter, partial [Anaerolineaceae bacterium]|nr:MFS transporter [Anaerolineaceae bacterium]